MSSPTVNKPYRDPEWERVSAEFKEKCDKQRRLWEMRIAQVLAADAAKAQTAGGETRHVRSRQTIEAAMADNAVRDLQSLKDELASMLLRTNIIVAASTLMFAAFVIKGNTGKGTTVAIGTTILGIALLMTAVAFIFAIKSLRPPFWRAWRDSYEKREYMTLLVVDDYTRWVMNCWLGNRRTTPIQNYKKAHSVAVPLAVAAAVLALPGLALIVLG